MTQQEKKVISETVADETLSKSKKMIALYSANLGIKEIASLLNVRYNFVYNVISNEVRMNDSLTLRTRNNETDTKKAKIVELFNAGKSNTEISAMLKTNYQYVFKVTKELLNTTKK